MRVLGFVLLACSLLAIAPAAEADPGPSGKCVIVEEYATQASLGSVDPSDPTSVVQPGAPRPVECYY